jgi:hypothetical protein
MNSTTTAEILRTINQWEKAEALTIWHFMITEAGAFINGYKNNLYFQDYGKKLRFLVDDIIEILQREEINYIELMKKEDTLTIFFKVIGSEEKQFIRLFPNGQTTIA